MIKKYYFYFFIYLFFLNIASAEIINQINISGNKRVSTDTIKVFLNLKVGDEIKSADLNSIIKNLYDTNFFEDIKITLNNSILSVNVIENKFIKDVIFKGIKSNQLIDQLKKNISTKPNESYIQNYTEQDLDYINNVLRDNGYYFSNIKTLIKENLDETIEIVFDIDLGKKALIDSIIFIGDKKFKRQKLLNIITSEENKFWKFISSKKLLNDERIQLDLRLLENFYKNKGYYKVKILEETIQIDNNQNFNLIFNIDAGEKFYFENLSIDLPNDYDSANFNRIINKINLFKGQVYSYKILENILKEVEFIANGNQYDFVNANLEHDVLEDNKINIKIKIFDDTFKYYVEKINILGNNITIEDVIRNQFLVDEGDPFNEILFSKSINNIKSLGIFKNVDTKINNGSKDTLKIIDLIVEEKPTGEISLGAGVGTSGASTVFGIKEKNFLGKNIKLDSNLYLSQETIRGLFSYENPNFQNTNNELSIIFESSETNRLTDFGYKNKKNGFLLGTGFEYYEDLFIKPSISFYNENIETSSNASSLLKKQQGNYLDLDLNYSVLYDKRDQKYQPTSGFLSVFNQKIPLNYGDNQTMVNSYDISKYLEYLDDVVASFSFYVAAANSLGDKI